MSFREKNRRPRIVITGGPCSGKTTLFKEILARYPKILGMPELATILINNIGVVRSEDPLIYRGTLWEMQHTVEAAYFRMAFVLGDVHALVLDSGSVDNAAFLDGGIDELEEMFQTSREEEYDRYDAVLWLAPPPRSVFEKERRNNPARIETYEQAYKIGWNALRAWEEHPVFREVFYAKDDWNEKSRVAWLLLDQLFGRP